MNDNLSLAQLRNIQDIGVFNVRALLNILITDAILFFEVGKIAGVEQVIKTVDLIMEDYQHLKPEDFKLCFNNAMKGHYGKVYDRVDGAVILEWLMKYDNDRDIAIESIRAKQNRQLKQSPTILQQFANAENSEELVNADIFKKNMQKLRDKLRLNKIAREKSKEINPKQSVNPIVQMHQRWLDQFNDLYYLQRLGNRMVKKYGLMKNPFYKYNQQPPCTLPKLVPRMLDINAYLEHKQWQYELSQLPFEKRLKKYLNKYPK